MKTPATLFNACLVLGVATMTATSTMSSVEARPMHAGIDYERYLVEEASIIDELKSWMAKWKDAAQRNGWIPVANASAKPEEIEEDHKQRFFMAKQLVQRLTKEHPGAIFELDSPFTLMTSEEFAKYVQNSFIAGGGAATRSLREQVDEVQQAPAPAPAPTPFSLRDINFNDWINTFDWSSIFRTVAPPTAAPTTAPTTGTPATASPVPQATTVRPTSNPNRPVGPVTPDDLPTDTPNTTPSATPKASGEIAADGSFVDWTAGKCMPPIQNQGQCGSCWSFASVAAVETAQCIAQKSATYTKYSEQTLASCDTRNSGCNGGVPQYAMQYIQQNGLCILADDPYTSSNGVLAKCNTGCNKVKTGMTGAKALGQNEAALISALNTHPVVIAVTAGNDVWKQYKSGVVSACPSAQVDHAVVAVGYDATTIKVRNSWGPRWGEAGYIRLARSTSGLGTCKMFQQMVHAQF